MIAGDFLRKYEKIEPLSGSKDMSSTVTRNNKDFTPSLVRHFRVRVSTEAALRDAGFEFKRAKSFRYDWNTPLYGYRSCDCCYTPEHTGQCPCGCGEAMITLEVPLSGHRFNKLIKTLAVPHTRYY